MGQDGRLADLWKIMDHYWTPPPTRKVTSEPEPQLAIKDGKLHPSDTEVDSEDGWYPYPCQVQSYQGSCCSETRPLFGSEINVGPRGCVSAFHARCRGPAFEGGPPNASQGWHHEEAGADSGQAGKCEARVINKGAFRFYCFLVVITWDLGNSAENTL